LTGRPGSGPRIHVTGASGAGTTTLGHALAASRGLTHLDTDDFFWLPTDPPYETPRPAAARLAMLAAALDRAAATGWALSGSLAGWGDPLCARFSLVVFLDAPTAARLRRLEERERRRYGARIAPGRAMHAQHLAFLAWAARYEDTGWDGRSRQLHEAWLARLPCPVLRLDGETATADQVAAVWAAQGPR